MLDRTVFVETYNQLALRFPSAFPRGLDVEGEKIVLGLWYEDLGDLNDQILVEAAKLVCREEKWLSVNVIREHAQRIWLCLEDSIRSEFDDLQPQLRTLMTSQAMTALGPQPDPTLKEGLDSTLRHTPPLSAFLPSKAALMQSGIAEWEAEGSHISEETSLATRSPGTGSNFN